MQPYTGCFLLPTQLRDWRGAPIAIADAKNKFMDSLPPPQYIPQELRGNFLSTLDTVIDLVDLMEPNLHKMYLLVDKEKLDEMIGIMVYSQIQKQMLEIPPNEEPQFIMTCDEVVESLRILTGIERVFSSAIAWTASEEGERCRKEINRAHAAMGASFDRWLDATLPQDLMDVSSIANLPSASKAPLSPLQFLPSTSFSSRRATSLPPIVIKPLTETPFFASDASPYPVITPPPLSPLCRYRHDKSRTCRYCHNFPRKPPRRTSIPGFSAYLDEQRSDAMPPRKRPRCTPDPGGLATLVLSGSLRDDDVNMHILPTDSISNLNSPPPLLSTPSPISSGGPSLSPISSSSELEYRPLLPVPSRKRSSPPAASSTPKKKTPFWLRVLKFLPFL